MAKCVLTGGAGFIGSHIAEKLLADGHEVVIVDNFSTGRPENIEIHKGNPRASILKADIADLEAIKPAFAGAERVFHIAALADIVPSIVDPVAYYRANVLGTFNVLEAARAAGAKRFVYAASSSCYGIPDAYPTPESAPARPQYPYALTKYLGEQAVMHWSQVYGLPAVSLRLFNVYGPRSRTSGTYGAVFGVFLAQKLAGKPFTVVGDGKQSRDFVFVKDVANAFCMAAESKLSGEIMNVGAGNPQSVNRLVELLQAPSVTYVPKRPGEPDLTHADAARITKLLGWKPQYTFEQGVKIILDNIDYWRQAPVWTPDTIATATQDWFKYLGK